MRKKGVIIIPGIPYPPINGHKLKIYNLIKILSKYMDLHVIIISKERLNKDAINFLNAHSYKFAHFKLGYLEIVSRLFLSIFSQTPFQVAYYTLSSVNSYIKNNTSEDAIVFLNLIRTCGYAKLFSKRKKIVLDMVDLLSLSYEKSYNTTTSLMYKPIYKIEGAKLRSYEKKMVTLSNLTLCVNYDETNYLKSYGNTKWLPNGVNEALFKYDKIDDQYKNSIGFFGAMHYQPNIDAVLWLDQFVLDFIDPSITLYIIGSNPSKQVLNIARKRKNVIVTGFLEDPYLILNSCFAIVAPMQNGGGIQNKILETMALGKINILTSLCANPIRGAKSNEHFIIADEPEQMSSQINLMHQKPQDYQKVGVEARRFIKEHYTWQSYEDKLKLELKELDKE